MQRDGVMGKGLIEGRKWHQDWKMVLVAAIIIFVLFVGFFVLLFSSFGYILAALGQKDIGVIPIKGTIESESSDSVLTGMQMGSHDIVDMIQNADDDPTVSVIFLDINSGGGSVVASKEITEAVANANKPVVAYIGDEGASGAYYVASAADEIIADADALTGSIGVIAMIPNYQELLNKIGVNFTILSEGKFKTMGSPFEEMTPEARALFETIITDAYNQFRSDVLKNREGKLTEASFDSIADGRILNGRQALEHGLIDATGSRDSALKRAAEIGGITGKPREKVFIIGISPFGQLLTQSGYFIGRGLVLGIGEQAKSGIRAE
jgi:protease-4